MSFEDNPYDDRYQLDQCIDEIKRLRQQVATLTAERDEAILALSSLQVLESSNSKRVDKAEAINAKLVEAAKTALQYCNRDILGCIVESGVTLEQQLTEAIGGE